jgi:nucleotide-binding universal stress UspA family protein
MLSIDRILWPTDLSQGSEWAFPHAAALADWHDAELHILHVQEPGAATQESFPLSRGTLGNLIDSVGSPPQPFDLDDLDLRQEQVDGTAPGEDIVSYVEGEEIDLVVMGTHGRRGLQRLLIGSVAEEVLRTAPCPVLTVRAGDEQPSAWNVRNILAPVDFSDASLQAVKHTKELALTYGAQITLLHAVEEVMYPSAYGLEMADVPGPEVIDRVENGLAELAREEIGYEHVVVDSAIGYAPSTILDYAEDNDVDLIVIATHGRSGIERLLLGSVTERVVRRASVPVFVVKSFGRSLLPANAAGTDEE